MTEMSRQDSCCAWDVRLDERRTEHLGEIWGYKADELVVSETVVPAELVCQSVVTVYSTSMDPRPNSRA